ncbi:opioid-binding protein/cell adhesion molecule-like [Rhipicephalus microplus]|uniref:opioid-binding protein/cell adhesion molecule-like n=1 Tax=Rhipicephalus microplus TaxID=6941 RepID=UPI003F6C57CC
MSTARPSTLGNCSIFLLLLAVASIGATASEQAGVSGPPKVQEFKFASLLSLGDTVIVNCVVRKGSRGPYKLVWFKNGQELDAAANGNVLVSHQGDSISTLTLKDIAVEDNGNYTCVATNAAGSDEASAFLTVTGMMQDRL